MRIATILFAAATVLATGCGVDPLSNPTTYREYLKAQAQIACETSFRCCGTQCSMGTDDTFLRASMTNQKLIDMGTYKYDATQGLACLDATRAQLNNCDALVSNLPSTTTACTRILVGTAAVGQTCDMTLQELRHRRLLCHRHERPRLRRLQEQRRVLCHGRAVQHRLLLRPHVPAMATCKPLAKTGESCMTAPCDTTGTKLVCLPSKACGSPQDDGAPAPAAASARAQPAPSQWA
jgi:hypothetical protein